VATIEHRGDYRLTAKVFERLMTTAATTGLMTPGTRIIGIYRDDPAMRDRMGAARVPSRLPMRHSDISRPESRRCPRSRARRRRTTSARRSRHR
jgi:hypothetical protein